LLSFYLFSVHTCINRKVEYIIDDDPKYENKYFPSFKLPIVKEFINENYKTSLVADKLRLPDLIK
tara:strand:+ start:29 stop:223 length:195 start_codon:yes stop_codon:yes gene_type:complete